MTLPAVQPDAASQASQRPPSLADESWADAATLPPEPVQYGGRYLEESLAASLHQLQRLQGPEGLRCLILTLIRTPTSAREAQAWQEETRDFSGAAAVQALAKHLPEDARLPLLEWALMGCAGADATERAELLRSARRVMCADGRIRPIDRLRWLLMRHLLSGATRPTAVHMPRARAEAALADLPEDQRQAIARCSAYLARMIPVSDPIAKVGTAGVAWYRAVMRSFWFDGAPACQVPDVDQLAHAFEQIQQLSWMQRPVLVRTWAQAALKVTHRLWRGEPLTLDAAEALRIAALLLDSPVPATVAERFIALPETPAH